MAKATRRSVESFQFVLDEDKALPVEEQSTFVLRPLTQAEQMVALDELTTESRSIERPGERIVKSRSWQQAYGLCLSHIEDVQNFPAGDPKPWPKDQKERREYLALLSDTQVFQVGCAIRDRAYVEEAAKNS